MKHEQVQVTLRTHNNETVNGYRTYCPHLAVTPMMGGNGYYHITHIQTGARLDRGLRLREAFKIAAALGGLMDWSGDEQVLANRFKQLPQSWRRWARSH